MKVAFITRSTIYTVPGGDTVQILQTASALSNLGVMADVHLSNQVIRYEDYDLLHFFNITRPADILYHSRKGKKPYVVSTILCNYYEYDKNYRKGAIKLLNFLSPNALEYVKTLARCVLGRDNLISHDYLWKGQYRSVLEVLANAAMILPNSQSESIRIMKNYSTKVKFEVITNGIDPQLFIFNPSAEKDNQLVICAARIEGIKNQLNLIKALNNTSFRLLIIGTPAPNQINYYRECRKIAAPNVQFIEYIPQQKLVEYYQQAKVHVLPSWFETTGLSSIEAAVMGCNIVITDKGDTAEYFGNDAFYCNPSNPTTIFEAVQNASLASINTNLRDRILKKHTWEQAALQTLKAYQIVASA